MNAVVQRRLAFVPVDADRQALADRFAKGETISKLSAETGISVTRLGYCLAQDLVERDSVPENHPKTLMWVSCINRRTPQSITKVSREAKAALAEAIS